MRAVSVALLALALGACRSEPNPAAPAPAAAPASVPADRTPAPAPTPPATAAPTTPPAATAEPVTAPAPAAEPVPAPVPAASAAPALRYRITGEAEGTLDERSSAVAWPGYDPAFIVHVTRRTAAGDIDAIGVDHPTPARAKWFAWGDGGTAGVVRYESASMGGFSGRWLVGDGDDRTGVQTLVAPDDADAALVGHFHVDGHNRGEGWYAGELEVAKKGDRYDLTWTIGKARYVGVGLAVHSDSTIVACWSETAKACSVAVYVGNLEGPERWEGRIATTGVDGVRTETLVPDERVTTTGLVAPPAVEEEPIAPECVGPCRDAGACVFSPMDGGCVAREDADCRASVGCRTHGACILDGQRCIDPGAAAKRCSEKRYGLVSLCADEGQCTYADGGCRATTDAECAGAKACKAEGRCVAKDGRCWVPAATADACKATCAERGECAAQDGVCRAASEADCAGSTACRDEARCGLQDGECAPLDDGCEGSPACATRKACTLIEGRCRAATQAWCDALCAMGDGSAQLGLCTARGGRCVNPDEPR